MPITLLIISIAALGFGPLIARSGSSNQAFRSALDGFVTIGVGGLVLTHILPPSIQAGGLAAWLFVAAGMVMPTAIERVQHGNIRTAHAAALALAFLALSLHAMSDGVVLSLADRQSGWAFSTALAVVLHRIPVGIAVWVFLRGAKGLRWVLGVFAVIALNTLLGFVAGGWVIELMQDASFAWFQAFVAGSLLHVIFHAHEHDHSHDHGDPFGHGHAHEVAHTHGHSDAHTHDHTHDAAHRPSYAELRCVPEPWTKDDRTVAQRAWSFFDVRAVLKKLPEMLGAVVGAALIAALSWIEGQGSPEMAAAHGHAHNTEKIAWKFSDLSAHSEYALERWMHLALESAGWLLLGYFLSALLFYWVRQPGIPWLNRGGALQRAVRGSVYGAAMPVRACGVVPVYASLVDRGAKWGGATAFLYATPQLRLETVLFSLPLLGAPLMGVRVASMVCISVVIGCLAARIAPMPQAPVDHEAPPRTGFLSALHQALFRLVDDTAPWVVFGLVVAALIPQDGFAWLSTLPPLLTLVIFGVLAIPLYLCATGATPVAAALLFAGVSPGAAMVFLLAGPVTVLNSFRVMRPRAGRRFAWSIVVVGWLLVLLAGWLTDRFFDPEGEHIAALHTDAAGTPYQWGALALLTLLFVWSLLRKGPRSWLSTIVAGDHG